MQIASEYFAPGSVAFRGGQIKSVLSDHQVLGISPLVRWAFYAFVFSILFESAPIGVNVETTQLTGGLLVAAALLIQPRIFLQRPPAAFWCFFTYFCFGVLNLFASESLFDEEVFSRQFIFVQLLFLFWIAYTLMRDERTARGALISLVASCSVLSLLQMLGLTTTTEAGVSRLDRLTAFGLDSNQLAGMLVLGLLAAVGFISSRKSSSVNPLPLVLPVVALVGITIVRTGSRGGLLALAAGLLVFSLGKGTLFSKLRNVLVVLLLFGFLGWIAYQSELVKHRFEVSWEDGNMSEREQFYPVAWQMFLEKPLIGWGPVVNSIQLGKRVDLYGFVRIDPHNLILYVLTATGMLGAIPFFTGVWLCLKGAWRARGSAQGILAFAMTVSLLTSEMSVTGFHWKHHWLILAYALASGSHLNTVKWNLVGSNQPLQGFPFARR